MAYKCDSCEGDTTYASFSGGKEYYCQSCGNQTYYRTDVGNLPRATLLQTAEGREELKKQMYDALLGPVREECSQQCDGCRSCQDLLQCGCEGWSWDCEEEF